MRNFLIIFVCIYSVNATAQLPDSLQSSIQVRGYLRDLVEVRMMRGSSNLLFTNLVHHRLNLTRSKSRWAANVEIRTRLYSGEQVRQDPSFHKRLKYTTESVDLSASWIRNTEWVLHSNIDRLWLQHQARKWSIRVGRQRINWSMVNAWSPNDLFNSFNLLDFDFEERPGVDGLLVRHLVNDHANVSVVAVQNDKRPSIALRYFTDLYRFDWQASIGLLPDVYTAGLGVAGNLGDAGIKGEIQYYKPKKGAGSECLMVVEGDYVLKKGWYISSAFLFNQSGIDRQLDFFKINFNTTPRNLMPTKWNLLFTAMKDINPRVNVKMQVVFTPGSNLWMLLPVLSYSLKQNLDIDLIGQSFFSKGEGFQVLVHGGYFRIKWNY